MKIKKRENKKIIVHIDFLNVIIEKHITPI